MRPPDLPDATAPPSAHARPCVLIVDDSEAQRQLMGAVLRRMDMDVMDASSAEEALKICESDTGESIHMILSDWQMPGMDGPDFCRAFRALKRENYAYFILMTSESKTLTKARGLEAGADDFLTRPVDLAELRARVRAGRRILEMQEALLHRNHEVRSTLTELQTIQDATERDLQEARRLQGSFLPPRHLEVGGSEVSLRLLACNHVGGDLVGYFTLPGDRLALYSIDVSGHGIASALLTGRLSGLFSPGSRRRNIAFETDGTLVPPDEVMSRLNDFMLHEMSTDIYFTAVLAYVGLRDGSVEFCQAGHPHPLLRRRDGTVLPLGEGGPPVGLLEGATFDRQTAQLEVGDSFLAYSDGLTECADTWGDMLEEEGLMDLLADVDTSTEGAVDGISAGLDAHVGINGFDDDVSMLMFAYGGPVRAAIAA